MDQVDIELKTVSRFSFAADADFAKMLLESNGIETYLDGQFINTSNVMYSFADGGIRLMVSSLDYDAACQVLKDENITATQPKVESVNIKPISIARHSFLHLQNNWFIYTLFLIVFLLIGL